MKYRESGMPEAELWSSFFHPIKVLKEMEVNNSISTLLDIGCGYGTFIIPASRIIKGNAIGIDIDGTVLEKLRDEIEKEKIENIDLVQGDVAEPNTQQFLEGYQDYIDYICLFNMLHCEEPENLLISAYNLLKRNGKLGIIHWIDADTPRGPSREIRPKPNQIQSWCKNVNFRLLKEIELPPYHFGQIYQK